MVIGFGAGQLAKGHPLTLFLNDKGVLLVSKANATRFGEQQKAFADVLAKSGSVIVCPMCLKHYGVTEAALLPGVKLGNPDVIGAALFEDISKSLTW